MKNSNRGRFTPYVRPVQRIELSEKNVKLRFILIAVLLAIAVVAIAIGMSTGLKTEPGWQLVQAQAKKINCSADFILEYDFTESGSGASTDFKTLTTLYSTACEEAFLIFNPDLPGEGTANVYDLNAHPNEVVAVDKALYEALQLIGKHENRGIYLAPVYAQYRSIFQADNEVVAAEHDPAQNPELMAFISQAAAFANDPSMIDIRLLDNNQVMLQVSEAYLEFVQLHEIERFVEFGWMTNAFIADYLAQVLIDGGFTQGYLASYDGFTRNLDPRGNTYSLDLFDRQGADVYAPAVMEYTSPSALVFLRDYPLSQKDVWHYYAFPNGRIASLLIDPADGRNKAGVDSLLSYGKDVGCAELLLQMSPVMITDDFSPELLQAMGEKGIHSIWFEAFNLCYTDPQLRLQMIPYEDITYTKVFSGS